MKERVLVFLSQLTFHAGIKYSGPNKIHSKAFSALLNIPTEGLFSAWNWEIKHHLADGESVSGSVASSEEEEGCDCEQRMKQTRSEERKQKCSQQHRNDAIPK